MRRRAWFSLTAAAALALGVGVSTRAEIVEMTISVDGLACPFCAYGIEKKLKKLEGVESIDISLNTGAVHVELAGDKSLELADVRRAVKDSGFTSREIRLTAIGTLRIEGEVAVLQVRGTQQEFLLFEQKHDVEKALSEATRRRLEELAGEGALVAVTGLIHEHTGAPPALSVDDLRQLHAVQLAVEGMSCDRCAERLTRLLGKAEGVYRASVSFAEKRATVESIGEGLDSKRLVALVEEAGFHASVVQPQGER